MSDKSSSSSSVISLPKGGGAQHGIGEKFSPDLHTGTGNFTVPITLPSGRNGFQPKLNLVYSTGTGNSHFGLGWCLSIPGVSRKTSKGIPKYRDKSMHPEDWDTFILSGAEDLVFIRQEKNIGPNNDETHRYYRPRKEGLFALIKHITGNGKNYWEVRSKDGLVSFYGSTKSDNDIPGWQDPAVIADPLNRSKVFTWKLSQTQDPFGNCVKYEYLRDICNPDKDAPHQWDQLYLKNIQYVDYNLSNEKKFLISVTFIYDDEDYPENHPSKRRPDPFSEYRSGFEIRTRKRCKWILIKTDSELFVRGYELTYFDEMKGMNNSEKFLPLNNVSLLSQIKVVGYDDNGQRKEEMPPLEFGYTLFKPNKQKFFAITGKDMPPTSLANPDYEMVDLIGNGLPDILEINGNVRYWRNLGNGRFDLPQEMKNAPAGQRLAESGIQLIDADGDGRIDLLVTAEGESGYYPLLFKGTWGPFQRYKYTPSFNFEDPEVKLIDLDGDGITDVIRSGTMLECYFNDRHQGFNPENMRWVERKALADFPNINFSDQRVKWADMTGDGLQDIVLVHDGNIEYWPNLGYGNWGKKIHMKNSPHFPYGYDPKRILIGDVDGDGLADIVYVDDAKVTLWINQSGNEWSDKIEIKGTPPVSDMDAVRLVDMQGSGISGVLWSSDRGGMSYESMFFLDLTGGVKPYLLNEMNNQMGSVTRVEYKASTHFYLEDQKHPDKRWMTPLPFPVQVVSRVEVIDEISRGKLTTKYRYHHGYWDGAEREFRGFGLVEQFDTETFVEKVEDEVHFSPPTLTKTWFHQGPIGDEFGEWEETDFTREFWSGDPKKLDRPGIMIEFLKSLPRRVKRDALRALRGSILRTELYALDNTGDRDNPYTVTEHLYGICGVIEEYGHSRLVFDPKDMPADWKTADTGECLFFPHIITQRTTQWERGLDPMSQFTFTEDYNEFGLARQQTTVAIPRREFKRSESDETKILATHTRTEYAIPEDDIYIHDRTAQMQMFELKNPPGVVETDPINIVRVLHDQATAAECICQQFKTLLAPWAKGGRLPDEVRLVSHSINYYDGGPDKAFIGRSIGEVGPYGVLTRSESLAFTDHELNEAYGDKRPQYLGGNEPLPDGAPSGFGNNLCYNNKRSIDDHIDGYYIDTRRMKYDFHDDTFVKKKGVVIASQDAMGHQTDIKFDEFLLLPIEVMDALGLKTTAVYDYRVMQPREVIDPNGNQTIFTFTPLGLLEDTLVRGKNGEGDQNRASVHMTYEFMAFKNSPPDKRMPIYVSSLRYTNYESENDPQKRNESIRTVEYSDGFGRLLQTRTQGEEYRLGNPIFGGEVLPVEQDDPKTHDDIQGHENSSAKDPNVVVSGWQIYDNKGRVVEKYEPFFSTGWDYAQPPEKQGQKATMFYDPRGQVIRTVNPNGSEQIVIYGVPYNLTKPEKFAPTPWEVYTYDANDNAGRTHASDPKTRIYEHHWNTPASAIVDALGRTIVNVVRNRARKDPFDLFEPIVEYRTCSTYDIQGNLLTVTDALNRLAFIHRYDLIKRPLRIDSIDAGTRLTISDVLGNPIEQIDSKGAIILRTYDDLNRPIRVWARDRGSGAVTLREKIEYGDGSDKNQDETERSGSRCANRLGKTYKYFDEAGLVTFESYDFKGNILEKKRQIIADSAILEKLDPAPQNWEIKAFCTDWNTSIPLDAAEYVTTFTYDALNRIKTKRYPEARDEKGNVKRCEFMPHYNSAGTLESVKLDDVVYVEHIAYNAKGQRILITYGNSVMTRYAYDEKTIRLARMRTEYYTKPDELTFHPDTAPARDQPLQDLAYEYDLAGNMLAIHDRTPGCGTQTLPDRLDRAFSYDPLYRLLDATGRQCDKLPSETPGQPWNAGPGCENMAQTVEYIEKYEYDAAGNITGLVHSSGPTGYARDFKRSFSLIPDSNSIPVNNRLDKMTINGNTYSYTYDANGNLTTETDLRHFEWDYADRMRVYRCQSQGNEPSSYVHCLYDAGGNRVKKLVRNKGAPVEVTVYIDGVFEHCLRLNKDGTMHEEEYTLHVMDDQKRIALVRESGFHDDNTPAVKYQFGDHLGSSNVVIDVNGTIVSSEEFTPYGETSFGSIEKKRYRFTGKERDRENGLYYHGARYYAPWLGRWVSCDPAGLMDEKNLFIFSRNNPICTKDSTGLQTEEVELVTGSYKDVGGHHPLQSASYTDAPGMKDEFRPEALSISQKQGAFNPEVHKQANKLQLRFNQAQWGMDVDETVGGVRVKSTGNGTLTPVATIWSEEMKGKGALEAAGIPTEQATKIVTEASKERTLAGSFPERVPNQPKGLATLAQNVMSEAPTAIGSTAANITRAAVPGVVEAEAGLMGGAYLASGYTATAPLVTPLMTAAEAVPVVGGGLVVGAVAGNLAEAGASELGASNQVAQGAGATAATLAGAGVGALIGAAVGGIGAAPGALVGGLVGWGGYLISKVW